MSTFELTAPTEQELGVQSIVSAIQALDQFSDDDLRDELVNLVFASEKLDIVIDAVRRRLKAAA